MPSNPCDLALSPLHLVMALIAGSIVSMHLMGTWVKVQDYFGQYAGDGAVEDLLD
jgi:hypothetical protein